MRVVGVDSGKKKRKAVACLMSTRGGLRIEQWVEIGSDLDAFCREVAAMAAEHDALVVIEDQFVQFVPAAKKLIEMRTWLKVRCLDAGVETEEVLPQVWQKVLKLSGIKGTRKDRKTKEKARVLAEKLWPRLHLGEDQIDAALIAFWRLRCVRP